jgi:hypothetical protein
MATETQENIEDRISDLLTHAIEHGGDSVHWDQDGLAWDHEDLIEDAVHRFRINRLSRPVHFSKWDGYHFESAGDLKSKLSIYWERAKNSWDDYQTELTGIKRRVTQLPQISALEEERNFILTLCESAQSRVLDLFGSFQKAVPNLGDFPVDTTWLDYITNRFDLFHYRLSRLTVVCLVEENRVTNLHFLDRKIHDSSAHLQYRQPSRLYEDSTTDAAISQIEAIRVLDAAIPIEALNNQPYRVVQKSLAEPNWNNAKGRHSYGMSEYTVSFLPDHILPDDFGLKVVGQHNLVVPDLLDIIYHFWLANGEQKSIKLSDAELLAARGRGLTRKNLAKQQEAMLIARGLRLTHKKVAPSIWQFSTETLYPMVSQSASIVSP